MKAKKRSAKSKVAKQPAKKPRVPKGFVRVAVPTQVELPLPKFKAAKPSWDMLSKQAAENLRALRAAVVAGAQKMYDDAKVLEVRKLAAEQGVPSGLVQAWLTAAELVTVSP